MVNKQLKTITLKSLYSVPFGTPKLFFLGSVQHLVFGFLFSFVCEYIFLPLLILDQFALEAVYFSSKQKKTNKETKKLVALFCGEAVIFISLQFSYYEGYLSDHSLR